MKWKPAEKDIIDYLYGSMTSETREKFETYIKAHPEVRQEIDELRQTMKMLPSFQDEEVIVPAPFTGAGTPRSVGKRHWLFPVSIAASIALILLTGYFTNFKMSFNQDGFEIGFVEQQENNNGLTHEEVDRLVALGIDRYANQLSGQLTSLEDGFERRLAESRSLTDQQIRQVAKRPANSKIDEAQVLQFMEQLQEKNEKMMQSFYLASAEDQKNYLRNTLLEYSRFIEEQRQEDIKFFQTSLLNMKSDTDLKQEATEKILANIISTVNTQNSPINNNQSLD